MFGGCAGWCAPKVDPNDRRQVDISRLPKLPRRLSFLLPKTSAIPEGLGNTYGGGFKLLKHGTHCDIYSNHKCTIKAIPLKRLRSAFEQDFELLNAAAGHTPPIDYAGPIAHPCRVYDARILATVAFKHSNIVTLKDLEMNQDCLFVILEALTGPSLPAKVDAWESANTVPSEVELARVFTQMLSAIQHLHSFRIVHRTLSSHKWVFTDPQAVTLKLVDYAQAVQLGPSDAGYIENQGGSDKHLVGNAYYHAPEILTDRFWSFASDVWSLGVIFYEVIFSGAMPFFTRNARDIGRAIVSIPPEINDDDVSPDLKAVIISILCKNYRERPTCENLLKLPWFINTEQSTSSYKRNSTSIRSFRMPQPTRSTENQNPDDMDVGQSSGIGYTEY